MARPDTGYEHRRPTGPQSTMKQETNDLEQAIKKAVAEGRQDLYLQFQRALSLQQSQTMELGGKSLKWWKAIAGFAVASAITMGTMMASCMNAYQSARVEAIEPAARAEQKAADASVRADTHAERLDTIENTQKVLAAAVEKLNGAVVALTEQMGDRSRTELHEAPAPQPRTRKGSR